jgi:hypothetical protein
MSTLVPASSELDGRTVCSEAIAWVYGFTTALKDTIFVQQLPTQYNATRLLG